MPGTLFSRVKQKGGGHGARNHKHASGNHTVMCFYASFHCKWRPPVKPLQALSKDVRWRARRAKNRHNRRKQ
jgi:hypothetical protein